MRYPKNRAKPDPTRVCSIEDCGSPAYAKGFCNLHYHRARMGRPLRTAKRETPDYIGWIDAHKDYASERCLEWPFGKRPNGYGRLYIGKTALPAHRVMCERAHGPAPDEEMHAAHRCGNPPCVNPKHLRWATPKENMADKVEHGTNNDGERHGLSKLTAEAVRDIRSVDGPHREMAEKYGVSISVVSNVRNMKAWTNV